MSINMGTYNSSLKEKQETDPSLKTLSDQDFNEYPSSNLKKDGESLISNQLHSDSEKIFEEEIKEGKESLNEEKSEQHNRSDQNDGSEYWSIDESEDSKSEETEKSKDVFQEYEQITLDVSSSIYCIEIFHSVIDTSQSFKIHKYLVKEESIKALKKFLPENLNIVSFYGISEIIENCINKAFNLEVPVFPKTEGIYLFYSPEKNIGALVFITENEEMFKNKPLERSSPFVTIIRTLTDLSFKIIACLSEDIIENWYFENDGVQNPFEEKVHQSGEIMLKEVIVQHSSTEEINLKYECYERLEYYLTKDNLNLFFNYKFEEITEHERLELRDIFNSTCNELVKLRDVHKFHKEIEKVLKKMQIFSFNKEDLIKKIQSSLDQMIKKREESHNELCRKILEEIYDKFTIKSSHWSPKDKTLSSKIKQMLNFISLDSKQVYLGLKDIKEYLNLKKEIKLDDIVATKHEEYLKSKTKEDYQIIISTILSEIYNKTEVNQKGGYWTDDLNVTIEKMINHMLMEKKKDLFEFKEFMNKNLNKYLGDQKSFILKETAKLLVPQYLDDVFKIESDFKKICYSHFNHLEKNSSGIEFHLNKTVFDISEFNKDLVCKIKKNSQVFQQYFPTKNIHVSQIISLDPEVIFVLMSNPEKGLTHVLRFNPKVIYKEHYEKCDDIYDSKVFIAWGSSPNKYIMFKNTNKMATHGSLECNKFFGKGLEIDIYSKITYVVSSFYLAKLRKLLIIDISGLIYSIDLINENNGVCIVKSNKRVDGTDSELEPLKPAKGDKFLDINISDDENIILLRTEVVIECYDINFTITHSIPIQENFLAYKTVLIGCHCFLVVENTNKEIKCIRLVVPKRETQIENKKQIGVIIDGNPIFDVHHLGIIKFGPLVEETQIIKGQRYIGYYSLSKKNDKVLKYLRNLGDVKTNFDLLGFINPSSLFDDLDEIKKSDFIFSASVRLPLHIASIQNGNLIPLRNGVNNFENFTAKTEKDSFLESLTDYIRFGNYEEVLENLNDMLVISIIGRQSSGKSYLLNRIAGTRFDVAAERCTDGIWMGIGYIKNTPIVVFDCEGLFTVERSTQEEIKLCLFISSISDLIILNSDLSSGKHIITLIDEFATGVDRLKGKNLFKGNLDIVFRDIPDSQGDGAYLEFRKFVQSLLETGRKETLLKLFNANIFNSLYHNFEHRMFDKEVKNSRNLYLEKVERKRSSDSKFCLMIKLILVQIFLDDIINLDIRMFSAQTRKLRALIDSIISDTEVAKKHLKKETFNYIIEPGPYQAEFNLEINEFYIDEKDPLKYFFNSIKESNYKDFCRKNHDSWYKQFGELIDKFFLERKNLITNFYKDSLPKAEEFKEQIDYAILGFENKLDKVANKFSLCLRKCEICDFHCTLFSKHEGKCNCRTDHYCIEFCNICDIDARCNLLNGHKNRHVCKKLGHKCTEKCKIRDCENDCTQDPGHEDSCRCSSFHPCGELCCMNSMCGQRCKFDFTIIHVNHTCEGKCPFPCYFEDGNNCSSMNHFHDNELKSDSYAKKHLCATRHTCKSICNQKGICGIKTELVYKTYKNKYNQFTYPYVDLIPDRFTCKEKINPGEILHEKSNHICESTKHFCESRCPDCNCFCGLQFGHQGYHSSDSHRNKECSEYIATEKIFESVFENKSEKTAVTYIAGDSATPEICTQYCFTKNRGHTHPYPCKGGDLCLEITDKGYALHSNEIFISGSEEPCYYDFVTCDTYWKKLNWLPPNQKTPDVQEIFGKCNFSCAHKSHLEKGEKVFCEKNLFHSISKCYSDHDFKCSHPFLGIYDIVFIIDCTGSMSSSFPQVKNVIHNLMNKWDEISSKFAIVGYTDHYPHNGHMPQTIPVQIFPSSKNLEDGDGTRAQEHLNSMKCGGGGGEYGEALIDGLSEANKLQFRKDSEKIYILICDDSPHGDEFLSGTAHPRGCPCGVDWRDLLGLMKTRRVNFIFVKLSDCLNKTVKLFSEMYGNGITVMPLEEVEKLEAEVTKTVSRTIESNFVFSKTLRNS